MSWPRCSKPSQSHDTTTTMFHRSDKILQLECSVFFSQNIIASHVNQYVLFWFHPSIKPFSNSPLACPHLFLESSSFLLATLPCTPLLSVLLMVGSWTWTLANVRKAFSCLEVTQWTFASFTRSARSDLCWSTTSQEGNRGLEFPPFVHNLSDCGFVESKHFRDGFVTFSSLMSNITLFPRSSVISFVRDMIHFHKHDQTLIDPWDLIYKMLHRNHPKFLEYAFANRMSLRTENVPYASLSDVKSMNHKWSWTCTQLNGFSSLLVNDSELMSFTYKISPIIII